jgi:hypothetical protein
MRRRDPSDRSWKRLVLVGLGWTGLLGTVPAAGAAPLGLFDQPQTFPWSMGLAPVVQEEAGGLTPGQFRVRGSTLWFNTYRQYGQGTNVTQVVDMEGLLFTASGAWSPAEGWELRGQAQAWTLGGGVMDAALAAFHEALGVPNQGRENAAANSYRVFVRGTLDDRQPASGLTQASVGARWFGGPWSSTWWVKPPVPSHQGWSWSDRWAGGWNLGWGDRWPLPDWGFQVRAGASAGLIAVEADDALGPTTPWTSQWGTYLVAELFSGPRLVAQTTVTAVPRSADGYLSMPAGLLTVGVQWPLADRWVFEGALTEEFFTWATMEVGFQAGFSWTHG